ncbi:GNAT family N-acetyltransferase [Kineococcus sp. SYSU DK003]|uniref:GNAT family N-acetyltransferase n=1 Tax=Kineococcus sp. SYSU DK003 TaxID=3383124 RepID=UPI003D7E1665
MAVTVSRNPAAKRYEAHDENGTLAGFAAYVTTDDMVVFTHTEVDPSFEGRGVGSALARAGLDDARAHGTRVMPLCPFINAWVRRHGEYADLLFNAPPSRVTD